MTKILLIAFVLVVSVSAYAQIPQTINYQGIARNTGGQPYNNTQMKIKLTIRDFFNMSWIYYSETRNVTTNAFGLFNVVLNSPGAIATAGNFSTINWNQGVKILEVALDANNSGTFQTIGTTTIESVPYSLASKKADKLELPYKDDYMGGDTAIRIKSQQSINTLYIEGAGTAIMAKSNVMNDNHAAVKGLAIAGGQGVHGLSTHAAGIGVKAENSTINGLALKVSGNLNISGGTTAPGEGKVLTSDASGNAIWKSPTTVAFRASGLKDNSSQDIPHDVWKKVMFYQVARYNVGNMYDASFSAFFPTITGVYNINAQVQFMSAAQTSFMRVMLLRNGQISELALVTEGNEFSSDVEHLSTPRLSFDIQLMASDVVWVEVRHQNENGSSIPVHSDGFRTFFTGHLVTKL